MTRYGLQKAMSGYQATNRGGDTFMVFKQVCASYLSVVYIFVIIVVQPSTLCAGSEKALSTSVQAQTGNSKSPCLNTVCRWWFTSLGDVQAIALADLRDQLDLHGISQAQQCLQEKLAGNGSAPVKRLAKADTSFREVLSILQA